MTTYYIEQNGEIIGFDTNRAKLELTLKRTNLDLPILVTENSIIDGEIITQEELEQRQIKKRQENFNDEFFNTSLGYVRRKVTMKDGRVKDFLTDILPLLQAGVSIITYNMPDFELDEELTQNVGVCVTDVFLDECKHQLLVDFYGE